MSDEKEMSQEEAMQALYALVIEQTKAGVDKSTISEKLVETGMDRGNAMEMVEMIHTQILQASEKEQFSFNSMIPAIIGGGLAAIVGGVIWGLIVIATGYEIGFMAWGLGLLSGFAVVLFSTGRKGVPLQVIAVFSSILGIAIGKYFMFFHYLKEMITKKYGVDEAANISIFSDKIIQFFVENIGSMMGGFDILWVIFAIITAWRIPKGLGIKL